ncbi:MAG: acyltransferase [Terrimicrobiaceae bacterium]
MESLATSIPDKGKSGVRMARIDGLRALAILGVMLHHFGVKPEGLVCWLDWGPVAPTVFFILSGYLITKSLFKMQETGRTGAVAIAGFHLKRLARLLPALYLMLLVGWFSGLPEFREGILWHLTFLSNIYMALTGEWAGHVSQMWSLSMQEQFYLLWPLILFVPARWLGFALAGVVLGALSFRVLCIHWEAPEMVRWLLLPGSLDAFAGGGLLALLLKNFPTFQFGGWKWLAGCLAVASWGTARILRHMDGTGNVLVALVDLFEVAFFSWLILLIIQSPQSLIGRFLATRPMAALGRFSYGLFIWHMLVFCAMAPHLDRAGLTVADGMFARTMLLVGASVMVAWLSWIAVERPAVAWSNAVAANAPRQMVRARQLASRLMWRIQDLLAGRESA